MNVKHRKKYVYASTYQVALGLSKRKRLETSTSGTTTTEEISTPQVPLALTFEEARFQEWFSRLSTKRFC